MLTAVTTMTAVTVMIAGAIAARFVKQVSLLLFCQLLL